MDWNEVVQRGDSVSTENSDLPLPEHILACPVSFEIFEPDGDNMPYDTPCQHTFSKATLLDILEQEEEQRRCPMCNTILPYPDISSYNPNRFAIGVIEAIQQQKALPKVEPPPPPAEPQEEKLPEDWDATSAQYDVAQLNGTLNRFQNQEDIIARHRNGVVMKGLLTLHGHDRRVAVKLVAPAARERGRHEITILAHATRHIPSAVLELRGFVDAGNLLIAHELPECSLVQYLQQVIEKDGGLKATTWLELVLQLADCLQRLHGCGVIHCDVSPAAIVRTHTGSLKLADFSSAHLCDLPDGPDIMLRAPVAEFPSRRVAYLAPEQLVQVAAAQRNRFVNGDDAGRAAMPLGEVTDRTDIWAFAVAALHLWTGVPPTCGVTPDFGSTDLPDFLKDLFSGCLKSTPEERLSASEVYEQLLLTKEMRAEMPEFSGATELMVGVPRGGRRAAALQAGGSNHGVSSMHGGGSSHSMRAAVGSVRGAGSNHGVRAAVGAGEVAGEASGPVAAREGSGQVQAAEAVVPGGKGGKGGAAETRDALEAAQRRLEEEIEDERRAMEAKARERQRMKQEEAQRKAAGRQQGADGDQVENKGGCFACFCG